MGFETKVVEQEEGDGKEKFIQTCHKEEIGDTKEEEQEAGG